MYNQKPKHTKMCQIMPNQSPEIHLLTEAVENRIGRTMKSPVDFDYLSLCIFQTTHEQVSATTLKRIWGYIPSENTPRRSTLALLARYLRYKDWEDFCQNYLPDNGNSIIFSENQLHTQSLTIGSEIEFCWLPNRFCRIRYEGSFRFLTVEARNAQIHSGSRFTAYHFCQNYPLFIYNLQQEGKTFQSYIAGSKSGITQLTLISKP